MTEITFLTELEERFRKIADRDARAAPRRSGKRRRLVLAVCSAVAVAAALALVAADPFGSSSSSLVAAARAASVPPDVIEHVVALTDQSDQGRSMTVRDELWTASGDPGGSREVISNPAYGGVIERADAQGVTSAYDPVAGVIYERTLPANAINLDPARVSEDLAFAHRALASGSATDAGHAVLDGRPVERFDYGSRASNGQACSYYATRDDYVPVAVDCTALVKAPWGTHARITYEFLARTPANDALLSLRAQHPGATVDRAPIAHCDQEPHYFGPGAAPDFAGDPRNAPCGVRHA
jgi:hypothetical protein